MRRGKTDIFDFSSDARYGDTFIVKSTGEALTRDRNALRVSEVSTHEVQMTSGQTMEVFNIGEYAATLTLPTGYQFRDGETSRPLQPGEYISFFFFSPTDEASQVIHIRYESARVYE
jgi:hypothetical protein